MDFTKIKNVHLTGIKGVGMTAMAVYLSDIGITVSGSDTPEQFVTDSILLKRGIKWSTEINKKNVKNGVDLLITTAAHGGLNNEEVLKAKKLKIPVLTYAEALAELSYEKETISVCGVGGKTTISSMLSVLLDSVGLNPSYIVGVGNIYPINTPGRYSKDGRNFICEADEYVVSPGIDNRPKFSLLKPKIIIATNIQYDHPDIYPDFEVTKEAFLSFFDKLPKFGYLIANADNKNTLNIAVRSKVRPITYGFAKDADYRIEKVNFIDQKTVFSIYIKSKKETIEDISLNVPGRLNIENAAAVFTVGNILGISHADIIKGLGRYLGCRRRFEDMGNYFGAKFFDDYAHHPGEINATIKASREWFPDRRVVVIFQPHTYSRTKALLSDFAVSLAKADTVSVMDIYSSAREKPDPTVNSEILAREVRKHNKYAFYTKDHTATIKWMKDNIKPGDIVLTMGAGDIFHLYEELKKIK